MSKLKTKLASMFFNLAEKMDSKFVKDQTTMPTAQLHFLDCNPIIMYDQYHVDRIRAQIRLSYDMLRMAGYANFMEERIPNMLVSSLANEIMANHKDEIKKTDEFDGITYSLDVYVCKPTKKESL